MIFRKRMILLSILLAGLAHIAIRGANLGGQTQRDRSEQIDVDDVTRFRTYVVGTDRWLNYQIPGRCLALRLFTNAALPAEARSMPIPTDSMERLGYSYCIDYEILDRHGNVLREAKYHFRASPLKPVPEQFGNKSAGKMSGSLEAGSESFFDETNLIPAGTRTMQLPLDKDLIGKADRIRLKLTSADPMINEVVTRLYAQRKDPGYDRPATWNRLSGSVREKLARASVYSPEMLTGYEKTNLLRKRWNAASPIGMANREFVTRRMYVPDHDPELEVNQSATGVELVPGYRVVCPLPLEPGKVAIRLSGGSLGGGSLSGGNGLEQSCYVRWFGRSADGRTGKIYKASSDAIEFRPLAAGGILELESAELAKAASEMIERGSTPMVAQVMWYPDADQSSVAANKHKLPIQAGIDITPEPRSTRLYTVSNEQPLEFSISHVGNRPTPVRLSLRSTMSPNAASLEVHRRAEWRLLDVAGKVVEHGTLQIPAEVSRYDRLLVPGGFAPVTEATHFHFRIPAGVRTLQVVSPDDDVVATAFTRPPNRSKKTLVPDDYFAVNRAASTRRTWFSIRPVDYEDRVARGGAVSCRLQMRPPEENEHIRTGDYQWESFQPDNLMTGRELLTARDGNLSVREEALPATFVELPRGKFDARWVARQGRRQVHPRLIYQVANREGKAESSARSVMRKPTVRIYLDGKPYFAKELKSQSGELTLPKVPAPGKDSNGHKFIVESTPGVRLFVNYLELRSDAAENLWLKRFAHELGPMMQFSYRKKTPDDESLMLRVFQRMNLSQKMDAAVKVHVDIRPVNADLDSPAYAMEDMTITNRTFELAPPSTDNSVVLGSNQQSYDAGTLCLFKLGRDLPAGEYRVKVSSDDDGYVMLYRNLPGRAELRSVYRESSDE